MFEDDEMTAFSSGPLKDKIVNNISSCTFCAYPIFRGNFPKQRNYLLNKTFKLYRFILENH
jgi:hypothetical protein